MPSRAFCPPESRPIGRLNRGILQRDQNLRMRSAIGEPDRSGRSLEMRGLCCIFQLLGALLQLFRLRQQQVTAGVDADIVEFCRALAEMLSGLEIALIAPLVRRIGLIERGARS